MARTYTIHKPALKNQYTITGPSHDATAKEECLFASLRPALNKNPFIVMYDGPDASCSLAAVSHLPPFARHFAIGLGDPAAEATDKQIRDVMWEELHMAHSSGKKHTWAMDVVGAKSGDHHQRRRIHLVWTRTRSVAVDGMVRPPLSTRNWKLTEMPAAVSSLETKESQGEPILAVFTSAGQMGQCGKLQINADHGRDFDLMVFITCLSLYSSGR